MTPSANIYDTVTASIIDQLQSGCAPWVKPWSVEGLANNMMPSNAATGRRYSGVNILLLWGASEAKGYQSNQWMTYKQCADLGGNVRKGEKATTVVMASTFVPESEKVRAINTGDDEKAVAFLKKFSVFSLEQCENLPARVSPTELPDYDRHSAFEELLVSTGADIRVGGDKAYYSPSDDYIQLVPAHAFADTMDYYRTAAHELCHWSGNPSRLDRQFGKRFGDSAYCREELVAEMGSAFVCASMGVQPVTRHADYIAHFIKLLREDNRAIFQAASRASKAADFILASRSVEMAVAA